MPNDLTKGNGSTTVATAGKDFFTQYGEAIRQTTIVGKLLKFSKGDWSAGEAAEPIEEGTFFTANMQSDPKVTNQKTGPVTSKGSDKSGRTRF